MTELSPSSAFTFSKLIHSFITWFTDLCTERIQFSYYRDFVVRWLYSVFSSIPDGPVNTDALESGILYPVPCQLYSVRKENLETSIRNVLKFTAIWSKRIILIAQQRPHPVTAEEVEQFEKSINANHEKLSNLIPSVKDKDYQTIVAQLFEYHAEARLLLQTFLKPDVDQLCSVAVQKLRSIWRTLADLTESEKIDLSQFDLERKKDEMRNRPADNHQNIVAVTRESVNESRAEVDESVVSKRSKKKKKEAPSTVTTFTNGRIVSQPKSTLSRKCCLSIDRSDEEYDLIHLKEDSLIEVNGESFLSSSTLDTECITKTLTNHLLSLFSQHNNSNPDPSDPVFLSALYSALKLNQPFQQNLSAMRGLETELPDSVYDLLSETCPITSELFSSPLTTRTPSFCSLFPSVDSHFGSKGSFFTLTPASAEGVHLVNPPAHEQLIPAMTPTLLSLLASSSPVTLIVILPNWHDLPFPLLQPLPQNDFVLSNDSFFLFRNNSDPWVSGELTISVSLGQIMFVILQNSAGTKSADQIEDILNREQPKPAPLPPDESDQNDPSFRILGDAPPRNEGWMEEIKNSEVIPTMLSCLIKTSSSLTLSCHGIFHENPDTDDSVQNEDGRWFVPRIRTHEESLWVNPTISHVEEITHQLAAEMAITEDV
ncbi:putative Phosphorylated CTD interacting factor 1 WW domain containing protein [Blattamonas nauphoetae]|uniref:Phosphorylated CTD interacting factor 1 WW domain containing protein n=1 Tax=Blattamonas nauphoetae TaxID=2049346 RepID=A0ABQ9Y0Y1_9EUKA|nr:putative Phosphorylated CTD interacting factor 1 WW domain containing protein [Blattamonas nauphoetae]